MVRGSTPTHTFELPMSAEEIKKIIIVYAQDDIEILRKTEKDCTIDGNTITLELSQEETLMFNCKEKVQMQLKVLTANDKVLISDIISRDVKKALIDEVIG